MCRRQDPLTPRVHFSNPAEWSLSLKDWLDFTTAVKCKISVHFDPQTFTTGTRYCAKEPRSMTMTKTMKI